MVVNSLAHFGALQGVFRTLLGALMALDTLFARRLPLEASTTPLEGLRHGARRGEAPLDPAGPRVHEVQQPGARGLLYRVH